jgi:hypothetical protein
VTGVPDHDEPTAAQALRDAAGPFGRPLRLVVRELLDGPRTVAELVAASGAPRRDVEQVLAALAADLERSGERYRLPPQQHDTYARLFDLPDLEHRRLDDVVGNRLAARPDLIELIAGLTGSRPRPDRDLDHVAATPETVVRRALWLDASYDLARTELLCIGDHDLTSLAVAACTPGARITVVDVDDRILECIDGEARRRGWAIRCVWGDFRLGLPASVQRTAGLAVTDPPYTPDGVSTFLVAALQGLADTDRGRIVLAYGYGNHQPALGVKVQQAVLDLHIAFEAILPGFNRYHGAQAIGSRSDLYVCRPTARSWRALPALVANESGRIYTHGEQSLESAAAPASQALAAAWALVPAGTPAGRTLLVGDGWAAVPGGGRVDAQRTSFGQLLARGLPPQLAGARDVHLVLDLSHAPPPWLPRLLLAVNTSRVVAVVPAGSWSPDDTALLRAKYAVDVRPGSDGRHGSDGQRGSSGRYDVLVAEATAPDRTSPSEGVVHDVLLRAHGKLGNMWREALVVAARERGGTLTKNEARAVVERSCSAPDLLGHSLIDAPRHLLERVLADVRRTAEHLG